VTIDHPGGPTISTHAIIAQGGDPRDKRRVMRQIAQEGKALAG